MDIIYEILSAWGILLTVVLLAVIIIWWIRRRNRKPEKEEMDGFLRCFGFSINAFQVSVIKSALSRTLTRFFADRVNKCLHRLAVDFQRCLDQRIPHEVAEEKFWEAWNLADKFVNFNKLTHQMRIKELSRLDSKKLPKNSKGHLTYFRMTRSHKAYLTFPPNHDLYSISK